MRKLLLCTPALGLLSGCDITINGSKWPGDGWDDTGNFADADDDTGDDQDEPSYAVSPDLLHAGTNEVLTVVPEPGGDWTGLKMVSGIGDFDIIDFKSEDAELWIGVVVPQDAMEGAAHLIFEFENGDVHFAREVIEIVGLTEGDPEDTGLVGDDPIED